MPKTSASFPWENGTVTEVTTAPGDDTGNTFLVTDKLADGTAKTENYTRATLRELAVEHANFSAQLIEVIDRSAE